MRLLISVIDGEEKLDVNKIIELNQSSLDSEKYLSFNGEVGDMYMRMIKGSDSLMSFNEESEQFRQEIILGENIKHM